MNKVIVIPDSFKGSLSATEASSIIVASLRKHHWDGDIVEMPISDGGEGFLDCALRVLKGDIIHTHTEDPLGRTIDTRFGLLEDGSAVIELATTAGLTLIPHELNPMQTSTYGLGQLLRSALDFRPAKIMIGLGGSATNDGGCGMLEALGATFYDAHHQPFRPTGGSLCDIREINLESLDPRLSQTEILTLVDVNNPLFGPTGASMVYGAQKGADTAMMHHLDQGLRHLATFLPAHSATCPDDPGMGAAGGVGFACAAFLNAKIMLGIHHILDLYDFDGHLKDARLVITGEGRIDRQSFQGKVLSGILQRTQSQNIPVYALAGYVDALPKNAYPPHLKTIIEISPKQGSLEDAMADADRHLMNAMDRLILLIKSE
jgi:glycerate kinase